MVDLKELRGVAHELGEVHSTEDGALVYAAADRIEELCRELAQARAQVEEVDAWLAKAADQLNITPIMRAMDLGNEITQWRLARQKHSSTVLKTEEPQ